MLEMADGTQGAYVDGAVGSDAAVAIARTIARNVDVVLVDTPGGRSTYGNAIAVAMGAYATMQREILESAMRDAYFQSLGRREFASRPLSANTRTPADSAILETLLRELPAVNLAYARPKAALPADFLAFDEKDAERGFTPYDSETFRV